MTRLREMCFQIFPPEECDEALRMPADQVPFFVTDSHMFSHHVHVVEAHFTDLTDKRPAAVMSLLKMFEQEDQLFEPFTARFVGTQEHVPVPHVYS